LDTQVIARRLRDKQVRGSITNHGQEFCYRYDYDNDNNNDNDNDNDNNTDDDDDDDVVMFTVLLIQT